MLESLHVQDSPATGIEMNIGRLALFLLNPLSADLMALRGPLDGAPSETCSAPEFADWCTKAAASCARLTLLPAILYPLPPLFCAFCRKCTRGHRNELNMHGRFVGVILVPLKQQRKQDKNKTKIRSGG